MKDVAIIGGILLLAVACFAAYIWVVQWAWNVVVPSAFDGPTLDFFQAAGVAVLLMILTGGTRTVVRERS